MERRNFLSIIGSAILGMASRGSYLIRRNSLSNNPNDDSFWDNSVLRRYDHQSAALSRHFNIFAATPIGHVLASNYINSEGPLTYEKLLKMREEHLTNISAA